MPWLFRYYARELQDTQSGGWRISYKEFGACLEMYIIFEVYDNYRMLAMTTDIIRDIRGLDLERVLGSRMKSDKL